MSRAVLPPAPAGASGWPWGEVASSPGSATAEGLPRISVVTPSFNQGAYLEATLRSVLLQGYPNLEYLVLDGGSSDDSVRIIQRYARHLDHWQSAPDGGQADAVASGLELAGGELACWVNSDDILLPGALHQVARLFMAQPRTGMVYGNRLVIDAAGSVVTSHVWPRLLTRYHWATGQPLAQECCFWRAELYRRVGGIDRTREFILDRDLFYRMWREGRVRKARGFLGCLRVHEETKNARMQDVRTREAVEFRSRYRLREPGPLLTRLLGRLDEVQNRRERAALPPVVPGSDPGDYGSHEPA